MPIPKYLPFRAHHQTATLRLHRFPPRFSHTAVIPRLCFSWWWDCRDFPSSWTRPSCPRPRKITEVAALKWSTETMILSWRPPLHTLRLVHFHLNSRSFDFWSLTLSWSWSEVVSCSHLVVKETIQVLQCAVLLSYDVCSASYVQCRLP